MSLIFASYRYLVIFTWRGLRFKPLDPDYESDFESGSSEEIEAGSNPDSNHKLNLLTSKPALCELNFKFLKSESWP